MHVLTPKFFAYTTSDSTLHNVETVSETLATKFMIVHLQIFAFVGFQNVHVMHHGFKGCRIHASEFTIEVMILVQIFHVPFAIQSQNACSFTLWHVQFRFSSGRAHEFEDRDTCDGHPCRACLTFARHNVTKRE